MKLKIADASAEEIASSMELAGIVREFVREFVHELRDATTTRDAFRTLIAAAVLLAYEDGIDGNEVTDMILETIEGTDDAIRAHVAARTEQPS